ncbi:MAG: cryptochrome/photolyase family protein [Pseudomonadota bacterium]
MRSVHLIFPHQLFAQSEALETGAGLHVLVEEPLFFGDPFYPAKFHKQKLWLHRASMKRFAGVLKSAGREVRYEDYRADTKMVAKLVSEMAGEGFDRVIVSDLHDHTLNERVEKACAAAGLDLECFETPAFLNTPQLNREYRDGKKRWFMGDFYKLQRTRLDVLMEGDEPEGGQWSFDEDNRKKVPKAKLGDIPAIPPRQLDDIEREARDYVMENWPDNPGSLDTIHFVTSHEDAENWLEQFLVHRFELFGDYEDAIVEGESWLWHSVLTPALNIGLLTPRQVVNETLAFREKNPVPLNAVEGFIRQIIGWREFMRATYDDLHVTMRNGNHWNHTRKLPASFYDGTTGIDPIDDTIHRLNCTAYNHHIERLMVIGGFMFLCEIEPDDIYRWFMEMYIDAYDWVMVPNVYAMSQNADGGLITTKPYFSGSNYVKKMSHWKHGEWADIWDGLYWRWIDNHREALGKNPRWAMMCRTAERMDAEKMAKHRENAETFLAGLG